MKTLPNTIKALLLCTAVFTLASCSKYQTNFISSANIAKDTTTGHFKMENDSVKITYGFMGHDTQIQLDVFNKLNEPLYIDWQKSAFIIDGKAYSYADKVMKINGDISGSTIKYNRVASSTDATLNATATLPKDVTFIPPHAQVSTTLTNFNNYTFNSIPNDIFVKNNLRGTADAGQLISVQEVEFSYDNSPIKFKNYLTLYTINNNAQKVTAVQHEFYVSRIIKSAENPQNFEMMQNSGSDYYYTSQKTAAGKAGIGVLIAAAIVGGAAIESSQSK